MLSQKYEHSLSNIDDVDYTRPVEMEDVDQSDVREASVEMASLDESAAEAEGPVDLDESVVGELSRELEECKFSLDDELMKSSAAVVELSRKQFQQLQQDMSRQSQEKLELVMKDMHEQQLHQLEKQKLDEICRLVLLIAIQI